MFAGHDRPGNVQKVYGDFSFNLSILMYGQIQHVFKEYVGKVGRKRTRKQLLVLA
jgi:hypothetical protein